MTNKQIKEYFEGLAGKHKKILSTNDNPKVFKHSILEIVEAQQGYQLDFFIVIESRSQNYRGNIDNGSKVATAAFYIIANYDQFEDADKESILDDCEEIANDFISKMYNDSITCPQIFPNFSLENVRLNEVKDVVAPNTIGYRVEYKYTYQQDLNIDNQNWNP